MEIVKAGKHVKFLPGCHNEKSTSGCLHQQTTHPAQ